MVHILNNFLLNVIKLTVKIKIKSNIINIKNRSQSVNYTNLISKKVINFIGKNLNSSLNLNLDNKQWIIMLYPWVSRFVENSYIIYNSKISSVLKKKDLNQFIPFDMIEFFKIVESKDWNIFLSNEVKKFKHNGKRSRLNLNYIEKEHFFSFKILLKNLVDLIFSKIRKKNNILILKTGLNFIDTMKLCWHLKEIPFINFDYFLKQKKFFLDLKFRNNIHKKFKSKNRFELFLIEMVMRYIPLNYLENFKQISKMVERKKIKAKYIVSAYDHVSNDYVKLYHAKNYKKVKFCTISHGAAFLNLNYNIRSFEREISHKLLVQNPSSLKEVFLPHYLGVMKKSENKNKDKICFIFYEPKEFDHFRDGPIYDNNKNYIHSMNKITRKLFENYKKDLIIVSNRDKNFKYTKNLKKSFGNNLIDEPLVFRKYLKEAKLFISTMPFSAFIQAFLSGPTILFLNRNQWKHSKKFRLIKKEMIKNKIIFEDEKKLLSHVKQISADPIEWWNSKNITLIKEKFKKAFGIDYSSVEEFSYHLKKIDH